MTREPAGFAVNWGEGFTVFPIDEATTRTIASWALRAARFVARTPDQLSLLQPALFDTQIGRWALAQALKIQMPEGFPSVPAPDLSVSFSDKTIGVFTTRNRAGVMALPEHRNGFAEGVDAAVLAVLLHRGHAFAEPGHVELVRVAGCISRDRFNRIAQRKSFKPGRAEQLYVDQSALAPLEKMVESFRKENK